MHQQILVRVPPAPSQPRTWIQQVHRNKSVIPPRPQRILPQVTHFKFKYKQYYTYRTTTKLYYRCGMRLTSKLKLLTKSVWVCLSRKPAKTYCSLDECEFLSGSGPKQGSLMHLTWVGPSSMHSWNLQPTSVREHDIATLVAITAAERLVQGERIGLYIHQD